MLPQWWGASKSSEDVNFVARFLLHFFHRYTYVGGSATEAVRRGRLDLFFACKYFLCRRCQVHTKSKRPVEANTRSTPPDRFQTHDLSRFCRRRADKEISRNTYRQLSSSLHARKEKIRARISETVEQRCRHNHSSRPLQVRSLPSLSSTTNPSHLFYTSHTHVVSFPLTSLPLSHPPPSLTTPLFPTGKRIALPTRVEPKVFFANERTFLSWLNFTVILGGLAVGLLNFGDSVGRISAGLFTLVAMAAMLYALFTFHWRAKSIRQRGQQGFDDRLGPTVLTLALLAAVVVNFVLRIVGGDKKK